MHALCIIVKMGKISLTLLSCLLENIQALQANLERQQISLICLN